MAAIQHGEPEAVLLHAARNAFFSLGVGPLKTLAREWQIDCPCVSLPATVTALVSFFILHYTGKAPSETDVAAIISLRYTEMSSLMREIGDDDALLEVLDVEDHKILQGQVWNSL